MLYGYTYENCVAFFPCYPLSVSTLARITSTIGILHFSSWVLLIGMTLNIVLFLMTSLVLFRLGKAVLGDEDVAFYGSILFCINPASIFMSALYSETMFSFFLFYALLILNRKATFMASILIGFSVFTRSNGIVGIGFIIHKIVKIFVKTFSQQRDSTKMNSSNVFHSLLLVLKTVFKIVIYLLTSLIPFGLYQYYIYQKFCLPSSTASDLPNHIVTYGRSQGYKIVGDEPSSWCNQSIALSYSYIQHHHWGVGFLAYYELKQLPNFLLAFPVILLSFRSCWYYFTQNKNSFFRLGLNVKQKLKDDIINSGPEISTHDVRTKKRTVSRNDPFREEAEDDSLKTRIKWNGCTGSDNLSAHSKLVVYVFHLAALTVFGCLFMHIQVLTRLLFSSSPLLYWYVATVFIQGYKPPTTQAGNRPKQDLLIPFFIQKLLTTMRLNFINKVFSNWPYLSFEFRMCFIYFLTYCVIGTLMFANFLPWT
ncbi:unnamed protein product [Lymnaea stagnalis]|uniref:GPI mannosyltransferase 2 n=1 Tax=Lymnaea stagnalis TaxID=6523 RepID=A0AAV2I2R2_LYMST